ncbi:MAG: hypothetical protein IPF48_16210 [Sphingomonadales bacterium]|jgi:hypothetical protein|nr:hypothetical protein [Sphingomonadales bacterium]MBK6492603.1 hypothetical protein [Sphingomonadales bacterium]MBK6720527.1 hypothetical protein [Sphingomonadales bacterium]MBK8861110.1 hypothetical protein [Sphingomonadales bacterium]MBK9587692.1 hypothetical protein [Sphingomonadales bacterium]
MIAASLAAAFIVLGFAMILSRLGLVALASEVRHLSQRSLNVLRDALLDDDAKEAAMQANARALFAKFIHLTLGLAFALLVPVALIWGVSLTGIVSFETVMAVSLTWPFLLAGGILFIVVLMLGKRQ